MPYLPDDVLLLIFSFLDLQDLPKLSLANKHFHSLLQNSSFWKLMYQKEHPHLYDYVSKEFQNSKVLKSDWLSQFRITHSQKKEVVNHFFRYFNSLEVVKNLAATTHNFELYRMFQAPLDNITLSMRDTVYKAANVLKDILIGKINEKLKIEEMLAIYTLEFSKDPNLKIHYENLKNFGFLNANAAKKYLPDSAKKYLNNKRNQENDSPSLSKKVKSDN